jgi:hypothetical protein
MKVREVLDTLAADDAATNVYGQPVETVDGVTVIPAARMRAKARHREEGDPSRDRLTVIARPVGVFVVRNGIASWEPAVDSTRIALMGELIGLVSATLATRAMVRRPPRPDLRRD